MPAEAQRHATGVEIEESLPAEIPVGSDFNLQVKVSCYAGCQLEGALIEVTGPDGTVNSFRVSGGEETYGAGAISLEELDQVEVSPDGDDQLRAFFIGEEQGHVLADPGSAHLVEIEAKAPDPLAAGRGPIRIRVHHLLGAAP